MAVHTGEGTPRLSEFVNPNDIDTFWFSWTDKLNTDTISTSVWIIPTGFTEVSTTINGSVTFDGVTYNDANSIKMSTTLTKGLHTISNEITTAGGNTYRRGVSIVLDSCL